MPGGWFAVRRPPSGRRFPRAAAHQGFGEYSLARVHQSDVQRVPVPSDHMKKPPGIQPVLRDFPTQGRSRHLLYIIIGHETYCSRVKPNQARHPLLYSLPAQQRRVAAHPVHVAVSLNVSFARGRKEAVGPPAPLAGSCTAYSPGNTHRSDGFLQKSSAVHVIVLVGESVRKSPADGNPAVLSKRLLRVRPGCDDPGDVWPASAVSVGDLPDDGRKIKPNSSNSTRARSKEPLDFFIRIPFGECPLYDGRGDKLPPLRTSITGLSVFYQSP